MFSQKRLFVNIINDQNENYVKKFLNKIVNKNIYFK